MFDRQGNELFHRKGTLGEWYSVAVSDSVVAYVTSRQVEFQQVPSGVVISTLEWCSDPQGDYETARTARNGGWMLLSTFGTLACISPDFKLAWAWNGFIGFIDAAFSDDGRFVAILEGRHRSYKLGLYKASNGEEVWSEEIHTRVLLYQSDISNLTFAGQYLAFASPLPGFYDDGCIDSTTETFVFHLSPANGSLINRLRYDGVVILQQTDTGFFVVSATAENCSYITVEEWFSRLHK